jgi:hypothetical protein
MLPLLKYFEKLMDNLNRNGDKMLSDDIKDDVKVLKIIIVLLLKFFLI